MPYRLTKIYTRQGDEGYTSLGQERLSKDDFLVEALGTVDELNAVIGFVLSLQLAEPKIAAALVQVQNDLFDLGGELHLPDRTAITKEKVGWLEQQLDEWNNTLPPLKDFVLPGGNPKSAALHMARTVCRRSERSMVRLHRQVPLHNREILRYLNRLSDLLFVFSRIVFKETGQKEQLWDHEPKSY